MPAFQPASFTPYYDTRAADMAASAKAQAEQAASQAATLAAAKRQAKFASIDAGIDASAQDELARRNEATAARQNQNAMLNREGTRAGGGRYRRRGLFSPGGSGLDVANSKARVEARKKAAYTAFDADEAARKEAQGLSGINSMLSLTNQAQQQFNNRPIGLQNGVFYL